MSAHANSGCVRYQFVPARIDEQFHDRVVSFIAMRPRLTCASVTASLIHLGSFICMRSTLHFGGDLCKNFTLWTELLFRRGFAFWSDVFEKDYTILS